MAIDLGDPVAVLLAAARALRVAGADSALYGGLALAAYGEPRETKDADLAVVGVSGADGLRALQASDLDATLAFDGVVFGGNRVSRITLLGDAANPGLNVVDLVEPRSARYAAAALARALDGELRGERVRVLAPEDFVLFKVLSTRERDLEDAATVLRSLSSQLDLQLLDDEVEELSRELPDHSVAERMSRARALPTS